MNINEAPIDDRFKKLFMSDGISELFPPQELLVNSKAMDGVNTVLSTPTASGKTFASELLILHLRQKILLQNLPVKQSRQQIHL